MLALEDGNAWGVINHLKQRWNRFSHVTQPKPIGDYLPAAPMLFASPSIFAMYASDFLL